MRWSRWLLPPSWRQAARAVGVSVLLVCLGTVLFAVGTAAYTAPIWWDRSDTTLAGVAISGAGTTVRINARWAECTRYDAGSAVEECTLGVGGRPLALRVSYSRLESWAPFASCRATLAGQTATCVAGYITSPSRPYVRVIGDHLGLTDEDVYWLARGHAVESMGGTEWMALGERATTWFSATVAVIVLALTLRLRAGLPLAATLALASWCVILVTSRVAGFVVLVFANAIKFD